MKKIRLIITLSLSLIVILGCCLLSGNAADTGNTPQAMANLVILVKFADDETDLFNSLDDYGDNNWEELKAMYNDTSTTNQYGIDLSFKKYISEISNGQVIIDNCFPQDNGTSVSTYTLANNKDYYSNQGDGDYYVLQEIITATNNGTLNIPSEYKLDNREGEVLDNLTVIFQTSSNVGNDAMLYPHKSIAANSTKLANRVYVRCYNFINSYAIFNSQYQGVITHEFMHSMGFPDLYRYDGNGSPVGAWDIMSQVGRYLQYPLTYFRSQMGWVSVDEITSAGSYTLNPVTTEEGNQAFIIRTPLSDSEFFVVEYRVRDTSAPASLAFESKVPQTGLLVYRVNTSVEELSNSQGNDYIYVFRPNETSLTASAGDILYASVNPNSTYNPRSTIGSTDLSKLFTDDTIFYSDGRNSGISISNVAIDSITNSLSFDVSFADYSATDMWEKLGDNIDTGASNVSIDTVSENEIYVAYENNDYPSYVKATSWNGTEWLQLGNTINNASAPTIEKVGSKVYLFYQINGTPTVATLNGASWSVIGSTANGSYPQGCDILTDGTDAYITYTISDSENSLHVDKITQTGLVEYATYTNSQYIVNPELAFYNGSLYAVLSLFDGSNAIVLKSDGASFTTVNTISMTYGNSHGIAVSDEKLYCFVAKSSSPTQMSVFDGSTWVNSEIAGLSDVYSDCEFTVINGIPYNARISGSNNVIKVYSLENGAFSQFGGDVTTSGNDAAFDIVNNTVTIAGISGTGGILNVRTKQFESAEKILESIEIKTLPSTLTYQVGASLNTANLVLTLNYSDGTHEDVSSGFTCTPSIFSAYGNTQVVVEYNDKTTSFNVFVDCSDASHNWNSGTITTSATCTDTGIKTFTCTLCGDTKTEVLAAIGHGEYSSVLTPATCTADAFTTYTCGRCDYSYTETHAGTKLSHVWNDGVVTTAATCTDTGIKTFTCTLCGDTKTEVLAAIGHGEYSSVLTPATCNADAFTTYTCGRCDYSYTETHAGTKLSHVWNDGVVTTAATCTDTGIKTFTCTLCGDTETEALAAVGHGEYSSVLTPATCTADAFTTYTCGRCDYSYTETHAGTKLSHVWNDGVITTAATCTDTGIKTFTCTLCGDTKTEALAAIGHGEYSSVLTPATCNADAFTTYTCGRCDYSYTETHAGTKLSHVWNDGVVTTAATCTDTGIKTFTCTLCGDTETEALAAVGHGEYSSVLTPATCTADAFTTYTCGRCDYSYTETHAGTKLSHVWNDGVITTAATCTQTGIKTFTCTICGETYTETIEKNAHSIKTDVVSADCTTSGYSRDVCTVCGTVIRTYDTVPALGHVDGNNDSICDECGTSLGSTSENCDCICHSTGFKQFIYKILRFFYKIFGINKTCECGIEHY